MDHHMASLILIGILFGLCLGTVFALLWFTFRTSAKAAEILKIYAERGEEPPQSVIDAVSASVGGWGPNAPAKPPRPETRGRHLSDFASCTVFAIGGAAFAWWRAPVSGENPGALMILALVVALIFTAGAVSHLVTALHIRDGQ
jgi:hypothetical protein